MRPALTTVAAAAALSFFAAPASALMTVDVKEVGSDVQVTYSGSLDLTGSLAREQFSVPFTIGAIGPVVPALVSISSGDITFVVFDFGSVDAWVPYGASSIIDGTATTYSGDAFGFERVEDGEEEPSAYQVYMPAGYVDGEEISGALTFEGTTLSGLSLLKGVYSYALPSDAIQVNVGVTSPVPLPAAAPLLAAALGGLGLLRRRVRG